MEKGLTFNGITEVLVNGEKVTDYDLDQKDDQHFDLTLTWEDADGKKIADAGLNSAKVEVYFNAILNEDANIGSMGNINECYLEYSNNPNVDDQGNPSEDTDKTDKDLVIAFTYKVEVNKIDQKTGEALEGAEFKLEKRYKNEGLKEVPLDTVNSTTTTFSFKGIDDGEYVLTETKVPAGRKAIAPIRFTVTADHAVVWDVKDDSTRQSNLWWINGNVPTGEIYLATNVQEGTLAGDLRNTESEKPSFEKKIKDTNDTTGETSGWQDSADYDIGDEVPYRLTAKLADNVTDYVKYHITFHDTMETGLTMGTVTNVYVNGQETTDYELKADDHSFDLTLTWNGEDGKKIADTTLNNGTVEVFFNAILNEDANLGSLGNVNESYLEYSSNPNVGQDGTPSEDTENTEKDFVIAFTYKVDVNKVGADGEALEGAEFKLQKVLKDNTLVDVALDAEASSDTTFSFKGLDDGQYILTETKVPAGHRAIDPITFNVRADHNLEWRVTAPADSTEIPESRSDVLFNLSGDVYTGNLTLTAEDELAGLTGNVKNTEAEKPSFEKKIMDTNDTTGETSGWQDSADYDIGDEIPYQLTAQLANNVTDYVKYHITFHDTMEDGLTMGDVTSVTVNGRTIDDYDLTSDEHSFDLTLTWEGEEGAKIADNSLNNAKVEVLFNATLNEDAVLGKEGNVNECYLEYSNNPSVAKDGTPSEETDKTKKDMVIAFTYKVEVNKVDADGAALEGAEFKLVKRLANGTFQDVDLDAESTETAFIFKGLDDGEYVLTETKIPEGHKGIDPITFTVTADHNVVIE